MPGRLLFSQLRIPTPQLDKVVAHKHSAASSESLAVAEVRPANMDRVKRPTIANLAKSLGSSDRHKENDRDRSASKDGGKRARDASKDKSKHARDVSRASPAPAPVRLGMVMESPPVLLIGTPAQSTGALISGRLQLSPNREEVILEDIVMYLECTTTSKRPVQDRCRECMTRVVDLYEWKFLSKPKLLSIVDGTHELPFSHLIPGHLPVTTHGQLSTIDYSLHVRARASDGQEIEFRRDLLIQRALIPGPDRNSVRIFPPTDLTLHVTLPNIVHPIGEFPVQCRLTGITVKRDETTTRWRLRKLTWRVEEHETAVSPACTNHAAKVGGEGKGISHEHTREIGHDELKAGWKTDFDAGTIEGEFLAAINPHLQPQTGVDAPNGLVIIHHLVLELVIAEEWVPARKPASSNATPTGAARVLRTHFTLHVTARAGMGISWDDEMPPVYEDVPASPPHYPHAGGVVAIGAAGPSSVVSRVSASGGGGDAVSTPTTSGHATTPAALSSIADYDADDLHEDVEPLSLN